jgi:RNA polymerase sigma-70 factor, ECF subfamily
MTERSAAELQDEARLVEAAKRDRNAFLALYDRYFDQIYSYCYYHTGRREQAEDLASETFQRALEGLAGFEWRGVPYSAWLYKVASNLMAKERRRPAWIELPEPLAAPSDDDPERLWLKREQGEELHAAVRRLPVDQRQAILLKFEARLKNKEIGLILGRSEGAVKLLLFRAIHGLRRRLSVPPEGSSNPPGRPGEDER